MRAGVALLFCAGIVSCGGKSGESPPEVPTGQAAPTQSPAPQSEAPPVLSPAPAPKEVFGHARIRSPSELRTRGAKWTLMPLPWEEILASEAPFLADVIELNAPIDVTLSLDPEAMSSPEPLMAIAFGLKDYDQTLHSLRSSGQQLERVSRSVHFFEFKGNKCLVARANGQAPARVVCSDQRRSLDFLSPYMSRTLPDKRFGDQDLFLRVDAEPWRERFGKRANMLKLGVPVVLRELSMGNDRFDAALADAAHAIVEELLIWAEEIDRIELTGTLQEASQHAELDFMLRFKGDSSFTAKQLLTRAPEAAPAPPTFWQLPKGVSSASYAAAARELSSLKPIAATVSELLHGAIEAQGLPSGKLDAWVEALEQTWMVSGPTAHGVINVPEPPSQAGVELKEGEKLSRIVRQAVANHVMVIDGDAGSTARLIDETVKVFNDRQLRTVVEKEGMEEVKHLPRVQKRVAGRGLPKGSLVYSIAFTPQSIQKLTKKDKIDGLKTLRGFIAVVPDGDRTWVGVSTDEQFLIEQVKLSMQPPSEQSLQAREGLSSLRTVAAHSASFGTVEGTLKSIADAAELEGQFDVERILLSMPNRGQSLLFFRSKALADGPALRIEASVPRAALEDIATGIVAIAAESGK